MKLILLIIIGLDESRIKYGIIGWNDMVNYRVLGGVICEMEVEKQRS